MKINKHLVLAITIIGFATISNAQIPNYVPTNGLVGWWPFNGNANDESGNGNNGTVNGATLTGDRFGNADKAYNFDGVNDFIELIQPFFNGSNAVSDFTISLWINQGELPTNYYHVLGFSSFWKEKQLQIGSQGDLNYSGSNISGYFGTPTISSFNSLNTWSHILVTYNQSYLRIKANLIDATGGSIPYSNLDFSVSIAGNSTGKNQIGCINSVSNGNYSFFNGKIDDIGIWNRALTACEIQNLYTSQINSTFVSAGADQTICNGELVTLSASNSQNYSWNNGVTDSVPFSPTTTQNYIVTADTAGCQSSDTVSVFVNEYSSSTLTQTALDSYTLNGQTYTQSGTYTQIIPGANGCDSNITLNLTLNFTGIHDLGTATKILLKITDLNGKTIPRRKNTVMLFIYEDGTVERVVEME